MANEIVGVSPGVMGSFENSEGKLVFETTLVYRVKADAITADSSNILLTPGLPQVNFSTISQGLLIAVCKSKSAKQDKKNRLYWEVTCRFDTRPRKSSEEDQSEEEQAGDPTGWTPRVTLEYEEEYEYFATDITGKAFANSAGTSFAEGFQTPYDIMVWNFTQYEPPSVTEETLTERSGGINKNTWRGYEPQTWICRVRRAELGVTNGFECWKIDYQLKYNKRKWTVKVLDTGPHYIAANGELVPFVDRDMNRFHGPLDGEGGKGDKDSPVTIAFEKFDKIDFDFIRL